MVTQPLILQLDITGQPLKWITYEKAAYYYCKDLIVWEAGLNEITIYGGVNRIKLERSKLSMNSIIAVRGKVKSVINNRAPTITNKTLFRRDGYICAYCNNQFTSSHLTRDHIHPKRYGGKDKWNNIVSACKSCNSRKGDSILEDHSSLHFLPYTPNKAENLFLNNVNMLDDQHDLLIKYIGADSRIPQFYPVPSTSGNSHYGKETEQSSTS